ncbi:transporter protein [Legionella wadsworthii]|uniref:Transporter protein n=1 Tax=Legionella wadsworthii TaxID=28088 RepID=A0A378LSI0_9GAMM|nr:DUF6691 family protein [Legionella wadsworthii]STY29647.1 transporter protein [Legionella wadsworthii]
MMERLSAFFIGLLFGLGLTVSNMINPYKILNFLDFFGYWDPTLLVVMVSAVLTTFIGYRFVLKKAKPLITECFFLPESTKITKPLLMGSAIFGIGWGLAGYCPGPSITALATFNLDPLYFVLGMILGSFAYWFLAKP